MEIIQPSIQLPKGSSRLRILEKIKDLGFETQNQQLIQLGFTKYSQNLRYLKEYKGDFEIVSSKLTERQSLKMKRKDINNEMEIQSEKEGEEAKRFRNKLNRQKITKEPRIKKEKISQIALKEFNEWPSEIQTVYLDGNNMLYVEDAIRNKVLGRRKRAGEKLLAGLANEFAKLKGEFNVVLIFDNTKLTYNYTIEINGKTLKFDVVSAMPSFPDSDDALVHWSGELGDKKNNCLFVTSDRGLQIRLNENGIENMMKPKRWFSFVKSQLGEENYRAILNKEEDKE